MITIFSDLWGKIANKVTRFSIPVTQQCGVTCENCCGCCTDRFGVSTLIYMASMPISMEKIKLRMRFLAEGCGRAVDYVSAY